MDDLVLVPDKITHATAAPVNPDRHQQRMYAMTNTVQSVVKTGRIVTADTSFQGIQVLGYAVGIPAERVGSTGLHMQIVTITPDARARPHLHAEHETATFALSGASEFWYGDALKGQAIFPHIPAGVAHLPYNRAKSSCSSLLSPGSIQMSTRASSFAPISMRWIRPMRSRRSSRSANLI